jgi:hypothetical protein
MIGFMGEYEAIVAVGGRLTLNEKTEFTTDRGPIRISKNTPLSEENDGLFVAPPWVEGCNFPVSLDEDESRGPGPVE